VGEREQPPSPPSGFRGRVVSSGDSQVSNGNIANIITVVRILLAPLFVWLVLLDGGEHGLWRFIAAALFIAAIATDGLDGALARKRNLVTNSGIILDPHRRQDSGRWRPDRACSRGGVALVGCRRDFGPGNRNHSVSLGAALRSCDPGVRGENTRQCSKRSPCPPGWSPPGYSSESGSSRSTGS
jgi:Phosphatidylglycerophosphate synthase